MRPEPAGELTQAGPSDGSGCSVNRSRPTVSRRHNDSFCTQTAPAAAVLIVLLSLKQLGDARRWGEGQLQRGQFAERRSSCLPSPTPPIITAVGRVHWRYVSIEQLKEAPQNDDLALDAARAAPRLNTPAISHVNNSNIHRDNTLRAFEIHRSSNIARTGHSQCLIEVK